MNDPGPGMIFTFYGVSVLVLLVPGIPVLLWLRHIIRKYVDPVPVTINRCFAAKVLIGIVLGQLLVLVSVLPAWISGAYSPSHPGWEPFSPVWEATANMTSLSLTPLIMLQSAYEELVFRAVAMGLFGVLFVWLAQLVLIPSSSDNRKISKAVWLAVGVVVSAVVSLAFASTHANNPEVSLTGLANIALAGVLLGIVAWADGDIWGAWALHFSWNATIAYLGLPVSGLRLSSTGIAEGAVPGLLSGGQFGPEASLPATFALLLGIAVVMLITLNRRFLIFPPIKKDSVD